jgi:hypothetical protein
MIQAIPAPPGDLVREVQYLARPREKRSFNTVLEAAALLGSAPRLLKVTSTRSAEEVAIEMHIELAEGHIRETFRARVASDGLHAHTMQRTVTDRTDAVVREERAEFSGRILSLPRATYPEVMLPFMVGWFPHDGRRRSLYAWINDRFVARVYFESGKKTRIDLPDGRMDAIECVMYPDLEDWVPIGATLATLAKPFMPKYKMWIEPRSPYTLLRFEGPYGPPGAPEFVIELHRR